MSTTAPAAPATPTGSKPPRRGRKVHRLSTRDKIALTVMAGVPAIIVIGLVWVPAVMTVLVSFTNWDGFTPLREAKGVGFKNYTDVVTNYPPFKPALVHNLVWLGFTFLVPTVLGIFMAVLLDREPARRAALPDGVLHARRAVARPHRLHLAGSSTAATRAC
ncbi:hypothetical protein GCM10025868_34760 [Angustibacter aerolatus]|uniref:ABC transmembrane type-1 domain-containing protein n=1 Tax=Angustibacter aerolatus TaxID=1162965 RepID=A0ABQ6JIZ8_9ACTN|nr:hypothetical protein [Angustibacter aerolatus]GMA88226.1 hypothetical protein GCM10025868_34760 [Angustibacter aerolatus]